MEVILAILVIILVLLAMGIRIVPQGYVFVIEFLGKYHGTWIGNVFSCNVRC